MENTDIINELYQNNDTKSIKEMIPTWDKNNLVYTQLAVTNDNLKILKILLENGFSNKGLKEFALKTKAEKEKKCLDFLNEQQSKFPIISDVHRSLIFEKAIKPINEILKFLN